MQQVFSRHNRWVREYTQAMREFNSDSQQARIEFACVSRQTHGAVLGDLPSTEEISALIFKDRVDEPVGRKVYTYALPYDNGQRPRFVDLGLSTSGVQLMSHYSTIYLFIYLLFIRIFMDSPIGLLLS